MKLYKEITIPAVAEKKVQKLDKVLCDLCKKEGIEDYDGNKWDKRFSTINNTQIEYREGSNYPDGGYKETQYFDICDECFLTILKPYLESLGAICYTENSDW